MRAGIYAIINKVNQKMYVGQTVNIGNRRRSHNHLLKNNKHINNFLQNAWNKYGEENFEFRELKTFKAKGEALIKLLNKWEEYYINRYNTNIPGCGYNLTFGGDNKTCSEETKKKISVAQKGINHWNYGKKISEETRKRMSITKIGKKLSEGTRKKLSNIKKGFGLGRKLSEETKKKMSMARKGTGHWCYGKHHTEETKQKISKATKGKKLSEETKKKIKMAGMGHSVSIETRRKLSEAQKGKKHSEETKQKISCKLKGNPLSPESIRKREATKRKNRELKLLQTPDKQEIFI